MTGSVVEVGVIDVTVVKVDADISLPTRLVVFGNPACLIIVGTAFSIAIEIGGLVETVVWVGMEAGVVCLTGNVVGEKGGGCGAMARLVIPAAESAGQ